MPYPNIDPIFVRIGPLAFRWYGLMYALSFITAIYMIRVIAIKKKLKITQDEISDLILWIATGVILGGRLGYVFFYHPAFYISNPLKILAVWEGGMSFHGGMIGVTVAGLLFCKTHRFSFYDVADVAVVSGPIGLGLGRMGNFINGELFGRATDVPWCMVFPQGGEACRHPSQLYQAGLEGIALFAILFFLSGRNVAKGVIFWSLILFYGLFRFLVEFAREPDAHLGLLFGTFSMGQILSAPMFILGGVMVWHQCTKAKTLKISD
ncbi:MAG: prolipoprotein diacylglyceryl transferase [Nitrospira sp.]|nr:prolipoprotein diacylglyceryl transferase [Candidatus Manganitrophaceae bacterium]HIL35040.1 prolipoprotein diacylglyceryl transferase [Candidatus Manganitrophaceae bacterium]